MFSVQKLASKVLKTGNLHTLQANEGGCRLPLWLRYWLRPKIFVKNKMF